MEVERFLTRRMSTNVRRAFFGFTKTINSHQQNQLPWESTLNNYFWNEWDSGLYWTVEMDLALVLVFVLMLVLMLVLVSVWVLK